MFDFTLTDEERQIQATALAFGRDHLAPAVRESEASGVAEPVRRLYAELGFDALGVSTEQDGFGPLAEALAYEALAQADAGATFALAAPGLLSPTNVAPTVLCTVALVDLDGWIKVENDMASGTWPLAQPGGAQMAVLIKDNQAHWIAGPMGAEPNRPMALHAAGADRLRLANAKITQSAPARPLLIRLRLFTAALLSGVSRAALEYALQYTQERRAFGKVLAHHQGVAFILADMATKAEATRLALLRAAWRVGRGDDAAFDAAAAFLEAAENGLFITDQALQLLGGHGYMKDHLVEKFFREARALSLIWGGVDAAREEAAAGALDQPTGTGFPQPQRAA